jgi:hypothetical protein
VLKRDFKRGAFALAFVFWFAASTLSAAPPAATTPVPGEPQAASSIRQIAYGKSGDWLYEGLYRLDMPPGRPLFEKDWPFRIPIAWLQQAAENKDRLPLFEPCAVDYHSTSGSATAVLAGFRTKFHPDTPGWFSAFFDHVKSVRRFSKAQKKEFAKHADRMRERSMVFYLAFEPGQVQWAYYPGMIQFRGGDRKNLKSWLPGTPEGIQKGTQRDYALIQDSNGLLGILNGTFDHVDNFVWCNPDPAKVQYAGFGYDGKIMMKPQDRMATFALYQDGAVRLGTYAALPDKEKIHTFVQNRFMVVENGKAAKDADPDAFFNYDDDIARSYLFTDRSGRVGFLWTLDTPPEVLAPLAIEMGVENMMLLDIHSPIYASLSDPAGPLVFSGYRDYSKRSYDLVPNFFKMSIWKATLAWVSLAIDSQIQTPYAQEAFRLGTEDYFAVFLKDAPEAKRVRENH